MVLIPSVFITELYNKQTKMPSNGVYATIPRAQYLSGRIRFLLVSEFLAEEELAL